MMHVPEPGEPQNLVDAIVGTNVEDVGARASEMTESFSWSRSAGECTSVTGHVMGIGFRE